MGNVLKPGSSYGKYIRSKYVIWAQNLPQNVSKRVISTKYGANIEYLKH